MTHIRLSATSVFACDSCGVKATIALHEKGSTFKSRYCDDCIPPPEPAVITPIRPDVVIIPNGPKAPI